MAGIAASLRVHPSLDVVCIDPDSPAGLQKIEDLAPSVIAFDLTTVPSGQVVTLLRAQPGPLLIGVDPSSNEMLVLSGQPAQALSIADLITVISQREKNLEPVTGSSYEKD